MHSHRPSARRGCAGVAESRLRNRQPNASPRLTKSASTRGRIATFAVVKARGISGGILAGPVGPRERLAIRYPIVEARVGMRVAHRGSRFSGTVESVRSNEVSIAGTTGLVRQFPLEPGVFVVDGAPVTLRRGPSKTTAAPRTASGSVAVPGARARTARASRIVVEGMHDAELLERVWGDDLRIVGVVVERLDGLAHIEAFLTDFQPGPSRQSACWSTISSPAVKRSGLPGAGRVPTCCSPAPRTSTCGQQFGRGCWGSNAGPRFRRVSRSRKACAALGYDEPRDLWNDLSRSVKSYKDLEVSVVGAVERLIDFVTTG